MIGHMKNPPHPGGIITETLEETGLSLRELAKRLDVAPSTLSRLAKGEIALTGEMAVKIAAVIGGSAHVWLAMMADYTAAQAEKTVNVSHLKRLELPDESNIDALH